MLNIKKVRLRPGMKGQENDTGWNKVARDLRIGRKGCAQVTAREARLIITGRKESKATLG